MPTLALWAPPPYDADELFSAGSRLNRDDCLSCFRALKANAEMLGWECHTKDVFEREGRIPEVLLFLDIPRQPLRELLDNRYEGTKKWVILQECAVVRRINWDLKAQAQFSKIFTWNDAFVDNLRYFKLNFAQDIPEEIQKSTKKQRLCTMIVANKRSWHRLELYSERLTAIRWFEANHPKDFALFGFGWGKAASGFSRLVSSWSRRPSLVCYQGTVEQKTPILARHRFAICYENARDIPGYVTEKIIDCFKAGCVPVYLGANNITDHIPSDCFIDKREFSDYADLYTYLAAMDETRYQHYLDSIERFLTGGGAEQFSTAVYAKVLCDALAAEG